MRAAKEKGPKPIAGSGPLKFGPSYCSVIEWCSWVHLGETVCVFVLTAQVPHASADLHGTCTAGFVPEVMRDLQPCPTDGAGLEVTVIGEVKQGISQARDLHRARRDARIGAGAALSWNTRELKVKLLAAF